MEITYEVIPIEKADICKPLVNELMVFQKSKARINPELFDGMSYETRMVPSIKNAVSNHIVIAKDGDTPVGYAYSNISPKEAYSTPFATFFDLSSVEKDNVGCLSQFYIRDGYRQYGIGSKLFRMSMEWLNRFDDVEDLFIFVSNGNEFALEYYQKKGFSVSHEILDGFITILRSRSRRRGESA